jgi:hypothetical protein
MTKPRGLGLSDELIQRILMKILNLEEVTSFSDCLCLIEIALPIGWPILRFARFGRVDYRKTYRSEIVS